MVRRYCQSCGTLLNQCPECGEWFSKKRIDQILCTNRCNKRMERRKKKESLITVTSDIVGEIKEDSK